jgi:hypothetical protein
MHKDLKQALNKMVDILKSDERCIGGWHFGWVSRGMMDEHSDYDPIFLIKSESFNEFEAGIPKLMKNISDELIICWAEDFNNDFIKNICCAIRVGEKLHQIDFFMMNTNNLDDYMCKLHYEGSTKENIIFDKTGETAALLDRELSLDDRNYDHLKIMDTYWFHVIMLVKYFKRKDIFKLIKNIDILFHAHTDLLLSRYDTLSWGGWESKVKHCVPAEKQEYLKAYFTQADIFSILTAVRKGISFFMVDSEDICRENEINYIESVACKVISYFNKELD